VSIEHMAVVLHHSRAKGTDKLILLGIANHEGDGGAHPGVPTLARYANVAESSAREAVRRLEASGEVEVVIGGGPLMPNGGRTNAYRVLVVCPPECDRSPHHRLSTPTGPPVGGQPVDNGDPHRSTGATPHRSTGGEPSKNHPRTTPQPPTAPELPESVARLWTGEGISNDDQQALWAAVLADPQTTVPAARARQRAWFVPTLAKIHAAHGKSVGTALATIRRHADECEHGEPGGSELHPTTGLPLCALCRAKATA
jgi:hypothetical protein